MLVTLKDKYDIKSESRWTVEKSFTSHVPSRNVINCKLSYKIVIASTERVRDRERCVVVR